MNPLWYQPLLLAASFWPVWMWFFERLTDRSDEPLGIVALLALIAIPFSQQTKQTLNQASTASATMSFAYPLVPLGMYLVTYPFAPKIIHALLALLTLASLLVFLKLKRMYPGDWLLLVLSLPVVASANFYLGYPMRCLVTNLAQVSLRMSGLAVETQGTSLFYNSQIVEVDAPCSGIKMLWLAAFIAAALASYFRLRWLPLTFLGVIAVVAALLGNVLRVCSLFYLEADIFRITIAAAQEESMHQAIGVSSFVVVAGLVAGVATWMSSKPSLISRTEQPAAIAESCRHASVPLSILLPTCLVLAAMPLVPSSQSAASIANNEFPGWPSTFEGQPLEQRHLSKIENDFLKAFPGKMAGFRCGNRQVVLRWIARETRQLHPSSDCFRSQGFDIKWKPMLIQGNVRWSCFEASLGADRLKVRERIVDSAQHSFSDVSAWYWSALAGQTTGPWWSFTVIEAP